MERLFDFLNNSVSPFHGVLECEKILKEAGFTKLQENKTYNLENAKGYYVVRNDASIIAFIMPNNSVKSFKIIANLIYHSLTKSRAVILRLLSFFIHQFFLALRR